jgi:dTDP-4-amino-4,6-dideoxygalactose transaminase
MGVAWSPAGDNVKALIPFNQPYLTGRELSYIADAHSRAQLAGDGYYSRKCQTWLQETMGCPVALLTHSCTAALEMAAILCGLGPGDEVIMPSYTFVSTANAFVLRGAVPVFVDIRKETLNIDEDLIEAAITPRTKVIVPVHYAGVACEMDTIMDIARKHSLLVVEDAAQAVMAFYKGKSLGTIGDFGCYSFHETKNIIAGEGGALLVNNPDFAERAEMIREKGTDRKRFLRGEVDKYTWMDIGSSYLPGEVVAAFLWAQMEEAEAITARRLKLWHVYYDSLQSLESSGRVRRASLPDNCTHNAHLSYLLMKDADDRNTFIERMRDRDINCVFHYIPLHSSPAGRQLGRLGSTMHNTIDCADRLVRLPLWLGLEEQQQRVVEAVFASLTPGPSTWLPA